MFKGIGQQKDTLLITKALINRQVSFFSPKNLESLLVTYFQFSYRACFKILPKILCFNTMRYTFNMVTMMKEKVNTHFSFPMKLNMAPYAEEYLMQNKDQGTIVCCWLKILSRTLQSVQTLFSYFTLFRIHPMHAVLSISLETYFNQSHMHLQITNVIR